MSSTGRDVFGKARVGGRIGQLARTVAVTGEYPAAFHDDGAHRDFSPLGSRSRLGECDIHRSRPCHHHGNCSQRRS